MSDYTEIIFEDEERKDISGMSKYQICNLGKIKIKATSKIMKQRIVGEYMRVKITDDNSKRKSILIHVYVAKYFVENTNPEKYSIVDHIDGNKMNNDYTNLRWTDHSGNMQNYQNFRKYNGRETVQYKEMTIVNEWKDIKEVVKQTGYNYKSVMNAISKNISFDTFIWKYKYDVVEIYHENEEFKNIGIIETNDLSKYEISTHGQVRNINRNKYIKPTIVSGYKKIILYNEKLERITLYIHRIVAEVFVTGKSEINKIVNHLDRNRLNNHYENLEWITVKGNTIHAIGRKVNQIDIVSRDVINTFDTITDAYKYFNRPCNSHISRCCKGAGNYVLGYDWEYAD